MIGQSSCTYQYQEISSHQACQNQIPFNHQIPLSFPSSTSLVQPSNCNSRRNPTPIGPPPRANFNPTITPPTSQSTQPQTQIQQQQPPNGTTSNYTTYPVSYLVQPPPPQPFSPMDFMRYYTMYNRMPIMPFQPVIFHHPSNLQITHLNLATGGFASSTPSATITTASTTTSNQSSGSNIAFGPPPRDRKNLSNMYDEKCCRSNEDTSVDVNGADKDENQLQDKQNDNVNSPLAPEDNPDMMEISGPVNLKYIENFCVQAERIALKNQHRPCFKNIQHLCNRTRSDIMKPNTTVANIHSQGIPWALKDFIFAFIRLVNATHILHGYVDFKSGSLGKIENHLTNDFKSCYQGWEKLTKDQLIPAITKIIMELDNLSNSSGAQPSSAASASSATSSASAAPKNCYATAASSNEEFNRGARMKQLDLVPETVFAQQRNVPGLLRVNLGETQMPITAAAVDLGMSDEDSDADTTTYINPGTHKPLPRTMAVPAHLVQQMGGSVAMLAEELREPMRDDKHWHSAIESIKQMQLLPGLSGDDMKMFAEVETNPRLYRYY